MTRRLRPPAPLRVRCHADGRPATLWRGGRARVVTRIAATWVRPAPWWTEEDDAPADPLRAARTYYRVVADGTVVYEIFQSALEGRWYIEKIID